jgi:hypothetical protein
LTGVKDPSSNSLPVESQAVTPDATATSSAENQLVINSVARGVIELPELGRVQVSARTKDGEVSVRIVADHPETTAILQPQTSAMAAEARVAGGHAVRVDVESRGDARGSQVGGESPGDKGGRGPAKGSESEEVTEVAPTAARPQVRIVL